TNYAVRRSIQRKLPNGHGNFFESSERCQGGHI
ncbi:MAG: hypothetical protein ACI93H_001128, partial [Psychromonas sp.]